MGERPKEKLSPPHSISEDTDGEHREEGEGEMQAAPCDHYQLDCWIQHGAGSYTSDTVLCLYYISAGIINGKRWRTVISHAMHLPLQCYLNSLQPPAAYCSTHVVMQRIAIYISWNEKDGESIQKVYKRKQCTLRPDRGSVCPVRFKWTANAAVDWVIRADVGHVRCNSFRYFVRLQLFLLR